MEQSARAHVTRRLRLTARMPVGTATIGCSGAKADDETGTAEAALDIAEADGSAETVLVVAGEEIEAGGLRVRVDEVHPWNPPHPAGVVLSWDG